MSEHIKSPVELQIDQLAACNVGGRIRAAICELEELLCFIEQRDLLEEGECVVAVTGHGYWGKGEDLEAAVDECRKDGASGTQEVVIYLYSGPKEELAKVYVDDYGAIQYPQTVTSRRVGKVKLPMKQKEAK